jgi:hypothetical protein
MPTSIPPFVIRNEIRGTSPGGEIWQTGFWNDCLGTPFTAADLATYLGVIAPYVTTWWNAIKANIYSTFTLTEVRAYYYQSSGQHADFGNVALLTPNAGTFAGNGNPIDTALVHSLRSVRVGSSHRGRMYVPHHSTVLNTGLIQSATALTGVTATAAMFTSINANTATRVSVVSATLATVDQVVSVTADLKPDVQRRRQNRLAGGVPVTHTV